MNEYNVGCGATVREDDDHMCPYFSRPDDWRAEVGDFGPCVIDNQLGTNRCVCALMQAKINNKVKAI